MPKPTGVHALVRRTHEGRVLGALRANGALSRSELALQIGLSRTTLSEITNLLLMRGAIVVVDTDAAERAGSGRPAERLALDPGSGQFMGVDFGHRRVHVAVADASHEIIASGSDRYAADDSWAVRLDVAFRLIDRISDDASVHYGALQAIGIGVPGPFGIRPGAGPKESWGQRESGHGVETAFGDRFGAAVMVDNNTRLAGLAEAMNGSSGGVQDLMYVRLSDGVGGGLVVGGRLVNGSTGMAGELGHVRVEQNGRPCRCGKDGCLETIASVPAIFAACRAAGAHISTLDELGAAVDRSQPAVDEVLRAAGTAIGRVLAGAAIALDPEQIVIGGAITRVAPTIVRHAADVVRHELSATPDAAPTVRAASLSDDDGALGAIAALFHQSPLLAGYPEATTTSRATEMKRSSS